MIKYDNFWETIKVKGISTYALINKLGFSSSLIHRIRHNMPINTATINDLCNALECGVDDIIEYIPDMSPENTNSKHNESAYTKKAPKSGGGRKFDGFESV